MFSKQWETLSCAIYSTSCSESFMRSIEKTTERLEQNCLPRSTKIILVITTRKRSILEIDWMIAMFTRSCACWGDLYTVVPTSQVSDLSSWSRNNEELEIGIEATPATWSENWQFMFTWALLTRSVLFSPAQREQRQYVCHDLETRWRGKVFGHNFWFWYVYMILDQVECDLKLTVKVA